MLRKKLKELMGSKSAEETLLKDNISIADLRKVMANRAQVDKRDLLKKLNELKAKYPVDSLAGKLLTQWIDRVKGFSTAHHK